MTIHSSRENNLPQTLLSIKNLSIRHKILIACGLALAIMSGVTFSVNQQVTQTAADQKNLATAQSFFQQIVITRRWVAQHGGVYVLKTPGVETNPYLLEIPDLTVDITDTQGQNYTLRNPALVTRELSEIATQDGAFQFHITSLNLLNPNNIPDAFETEALKAFEAGEDEIWLYLDEGPQRQLRYMAPLYVEENCLQCHGNQGYTIGDVVGGISVTVPAAANPVSSQFVVAGSWVLGTLIILGILYWALNVTVIKPIEHLRTAAGAIADGNYEYKITVTAHDEVGVLGQTYERMRLQVKDYTHSLETMVYQRTADLSRSEEKYRSLVEQSGEAIVMMNDQGLVVEWNDRAVQIFGLSRETILDQPLTEMIFQLMSDDQRTPSIQQQIGNQLSEYLTTHQAPWLGKRFEFAVKRSDGTNSIVQMVVFPIKTQGGYLTGGILRDITEQKESDAALRESNERLKKALTELKETQAQMVQQERLAAVGQLAAGVAHDFNNLMATVMLHAELMIYGSELTPTDQERAETIRQQGQRSANLTQQILDFSRKSIMQQQVLDIHPFLQEVAKMLSRTLPENILFKYDDQTDDFVVHADPTRLQQAILNLVINARDAMPNGGRLDIELARVQVGDDGKRPFSTLEPGNWVQITVSDTGTGISADNLPHIFEPFFTTKTPQGSGLGLSQVYGIIKQHGGEINVTSSIEQGTTFNLFLPALAVSQPEPADSLASQLAEGHGETILVVEDDDTLRKVLVDSLQILGYHILSAQNGQEALAIFGQADHGIMLVITDLIMPHMGGVTLLDSLRQLDLTIKVVVITGYMEKELETDLQTAGVVGWLQKPLNMEKLSQVVAQGLSTDQ
ncbi:MAG: DUF3365 domain-containing protein [Chloroflexi bacterium]|nr:MAG: DUF3365 domain-containing protein [Chloroflexota bacterium]